MKNLDFYTLVAAACIQAWALWGNPSNPDVTFAFGAGLSVVPLIRTARQFLEN